MTNMETISWTCRACGLVNPVRDRACTSCSQPRNNGALLREAFGGKMLAQVLNPGAENVYNNVYNFAPDSGAPNLVSIQARDEGDRESYPQLPPTTGAPMTFFRAVLRTVTVLSLLVIILVLLFFCIVVVMAISKAMGRW